MALLEASRAIAAERLHAHHGIDLASGRPQLTGVYKDFLAGEQDTFEVILDTFADRRNGFVFVTNATGAVIGAIYDKRAERSPRPEATKQLGVLLDWAVKNYGKKEIIDRISDTDDVTLATAWMHDHARRG